MKSTKTFIAYILVAVFLLGSIAASAQTIKKTSSRSIKGSVIGEVNGHTDARSAVVYNQSFSER